MPFYSPNGSLLTVPLKAKTALAPVAKCSTVSPYPDLEESAMDRSRFQERRLGDDQKLTPQTKLSVPDDFGLDMNVTELIDFPFAVQQLDRKTSLVLLSLSPDLLGEHAIREMKEKWRQILKKQPFLQKTMSIFSHIIVGTATVRQIFIPDHEKSSHTALCHIENFSPNPLLSHLFHNPSPLLHLRDFLIHSTASSFETTSTSTSTPTPPTTIILNNPILVLRTSLSKSRLAALVSVLLVLSLAIGACMHSVEAGLALAGVLITLVCGLLPVVVWVGSAF